MRPKKRSTKTTMDAGGVVRIPPLPPIPEAPRLAPDHRQADAKRVLEAIASVAASEMEVAGPNLTTGFQAAAVDLGKLQDVLSEGIRRFDAVQLEERWDEIFAWSWRVIRSWVQRCKAAKIERRGGGVHVAIETQDDRGYYKYELDVPCRR